MSQRSIMQRRLKAVTLAVLAAVTVDYAVSVVQGLRLFSPHREAFATGSKRADNGIVYWVSFRTGWLFGDSFRWGPLDPGQPVTIHRDDASRPRDWFSWTAFADAGRRDAETVQRLVGLPWRSWSWTVRTDGRERVPRDGLVIVNGGVPVPRLQAGWDYRSVRALPTNMRPLAWSGNIAALTIVLLAFHEGVRRFQRRWRAQRGLCTRCGYLVNNAPMCPECGTAVVGR